MRRIRELYGATTLEDSVNIHNGRGLKKAERGEAGPYPVYAAGGYVGTHTERLSEDPFVVIGRKGSAGKPTFAPNGGWVIDTAYYVQPRTHALLCKFLYYALINCDFSDDIISTAIPGINRTAIYAHEIPVPPLLIQIACTDFLDALAEASPLPELPDDLSEQRRIVEKVERLVAKIADASGLRNQSVMETEILWRNLSRNVFEDNGRFARLNLDEVCLEIIDCLHSNPIYSVDGIPTVRSPDVGWGRLFLETASRTTYEEYCRRTRRGKPRPGDIILVREGGGTGKAGIVEEGQQLSLGQRVMQLRLHEKKVLPRYLLHQWLSPMIQEDQIAKMMKGSASPHLNIGALKKFQVIIPPLEEQQCIVEYLDGLKSKVERLKELQAQTSEELDVLLTSILDKAFRGEL
jgi:restriction endonuclease S subunit